MIFAVAFGDCFEDELSLQSLQRLADMASLAGIKKLSLLSNHATRRRVIAFSDILRREANSSGELFIDGVRLRAEQWVVENTLVAIEDLS